MKWILIYILMNNHSGSATGAASFVTREACQVAGEAIIAEYPMRSRYFCVPEGEAP